MSTNRFEDGLRKELEHHVDLLALDYARAGLSTNEARRKALIAFGGLEQVKECCRDVHGESALRRAARDVGTRILGRITAVALGVFSYG